MALSEDRAEEPLRILCVCTGNICRSAFAHHYLADGLDRLSSGSFVVSSAGLGWWPGLEVPAELLEVAGPVRSRLAAHQARSLDPLEARRADLVLTATAEHRSAVLSEAPAALKRAFTMREFSALIEHMDPHPGVSPQAWREVIAAASQRRGFVVGGDVPDPYRGPQAAYAGMVELLGPTLDRIIAAAT